MILGRAGAHLFPGHFFGTAALIIAVTAAAGGAAVAAALAFAAVGSIRRRRAVAGGCVHCQFRCQHAMTEQPRRRPVARAGQAEAGHAPVAGPPGPPSRRGRPAGHAEREERAGSPV